MACARPAARSMPYSGALRVRTKTLVQSVTHSRPQTAGRCIPREVRFTSKPTLFRPCTAAISSVTCMRKADEPGSFSGPRHCKQGLQRT